MSDPSDTRLTHLDETGAARMVDVSEKAVTRREAIAESTIVMQRSTRESIERNALNKGDALAVARVAGILAAKRVDELIPLCHSLPLSDVSIAFRFDTESLTVTATAITVAQTGVEMEALMAASVAALTIYDMAKALDKGMVIANTRLLKKTGGKSGDWEAS